MIITDLEQAVQYLSDKSEPTNTIHWFLIGMGLFWYLMAVTTTYIVLSKNGIYVEVNPLATAVFAQFGMVSTFLLVFASVMLVMIYIPYKFRDNKKIGILCNSAFTLFFFLDGGHNTYQFFDWIIPLEIPYRITEHIVMMLGLV